MSQLGEPRIGQEPLAGQAQGVTFPVVALVAGDAGAAALRLLERLPDNSGMAFLVWVTDGGADIAPRLHHATRLPVTIATGAERVEPDRVYLLATTSTLMLEKGELRLESDGPGGLDDFLATFADTCGEQSIVVVLSGEHAAGSGTLERIRRAGGCVFAQAPEDAQHDALPCSAIASGQVDAVLPSAQLAQRLEGLGARAQAARSEAEALLEILLLLHARSGHDFKHYKRATVQQRLERRLQAIPCENLVAYRDYLRLNPEETPVLLEAMLTDDTTPLRTPEAPQAAYESLLQANQTLRERLEHSTRQNANLHKLIASASIASILLDRRMRIRAFTPGAEDIFALIPNDTGRSLLDIAHSLDYPQMAEDVAGTLESLRSLEREVSSDKGLWYIARLRPDLAEDGQVEGVALTFIDISQRRQAEERLRLGEERMRLAAECTQDYIIFALDTDGRIVSWNHCAENAFGYAEADVLGRPADFLYVDEERDADALAQELARAREAGRTEDERWYRRSDGSRFFYSGTTTALRDGGLHGFAKIGRDTTEKKRQEAEQESELERSQVLSKLKDEFFAMVSHELKHPLNLIQLNAELIARLTVVKSQAIAARAVETILGSVRSQARIIDDLLDLSRVNTGKLKLNREPVSLPQLLGGIVDVVQAEATARDIAIELQLPPAGTSLVADADPIRVEQIIWNLISNSLKFTPEGGTLYLRLAREDDSLRIDVRDTGQGIPAEFLPKVFDLFGQVPEQRLSSTRHGLGIGLALVRELVEAHQGRIEVSSPGIGQGSTFSVWLPEYVHGTQANVVDSPPQGQFDGLRVLMVDDSPEICEIMQTLLEMEGAEVSVANDGEMALRMAQTEGYDLILSDIGMPRMDGLELIAQLRQLPHHARTAAIALTGYGGENDVNQALEAGFDAHIDKPVSLEALLQAVTNLCGTRSRH